MSAGTVVTLAETKRDRDLVTRVQRGDRQAFEQLVITHQSSLRNFCRLLLRNDAEADDAAQESFFKAYRKIKQYRGQGSVKSWLLGIAANHCKDLLRANKHLPLLTADDGSAGGAFVKGVNVREEEERIEQRQLAEAALEQVQPQYRTVLVLREVAGFEYSEIAKILSCSLDAVKARLRRAREEFGNELAAKRDEEPATAPGSNGRP